MKFWIRVLVAVVVIIVAVFAVWAFFFREKDEVQAYNKTAELIDYKESIGFQEKLLDLKMMNYYHNDKSMPIGNETESEKTINNHRQNLLSIESIDIGNGVYIPSYYVTDLYLDNIISNLLPYTIGNKSQNNPLKQVKSSIDNYLNKLRTANNVLSDLINFQKQIEGSAVEVDILEKYYNNFSNKYREALGAGGDAVLAIMNYVDKCVFGDEILLDVDFALSDAFARTLIASKNCEANQETRHTGDLYNIMQTMDNIDRGVNIYTKRTEYQFLNAYTILYNNYDGELSKVYSSVDTVKKEMAEGSNLSGIVKDAQDYITSVLLVSLGF